MDHSTHFINLTTGQTIEITEDGERIVKVVTITATGARINPRDMKTSSLHRTYRSRNGNGAPYASGFVPVAELPDDHPLAPVKQVPQTPALKAPDFDAMNDAELSVYGNQMKSHEKRYKQLHESVKRELKRRNPHDRTYVHGDVAFIITTNVRFDPEFARANLTPTEYSKILVSKPDAELAKEVLTEERYKLACKDHGNKVEIKNASDEDRKNASNQDRIEGAKAEIDAESLMVEEFIPSDVLATPF